MSSQLLGLHRFSLGPSLPFVQVQLLECMQSQRRGTASIGLRFVLSPCDNLAQEMLWQGRGYVCGCWVSKKAGNS